MDWPSSSYNASKPVMPHRSAWSGTSRSSAAKRQRQSIKTGRLSIHHATERATYASLNTKPQQRSVVPPLAVEGVELDHGLLGAGTIVSVDEEKGGMCSAATAGSVNSGQRFHWTFTAEENDDLRLQPVGPAIPLFPGTIKYHPTFFTSTVTGKEDQPDSKGLSLRDAVKEAETFLSSRFDILETSSVFDVVKPEITAAYEPATYINGLTMFPRRSWKRRRESETDGRVTDMRQDEDEDEDMPGRTEDEATQALPSNAEAGKQAAGARFPPKELQRERDQIYLGNVKKLVSLRLRTRRLSLSSSPSKAEIAREASSGSLRQSQREDEWEATEDEEIGAAGTPRRKSTGGAEGKTDVAGEDMDTLILAFPMGENGSVLNLSQFKFNRPSRRGTSKPVEEPRHRFVPTHIASWSFPTPILQLGVSHATSADENCLPGERNATHLAVRTVNALHIFALSRPRRRSSKVEKQELSYRSASIPKWDTAIPADIMEITTIHPERTGGKRLVDIQLHPTEWQTAVMVDEQGGVWRWRRSRKRSKYARQEAVDEIDCVRPAQPQDMIDGFFRVSWGSEGGTILVASTKIVEKIMVDSHMAPPRILMDLSLCPSAIIAIRTDTLERGSGQTWVLTSDDIMWLDETGSGKVILRSKHHLGYDRSLQIEVEQHGLVCRVLVVSGRTKLVSAWSVVADPLVAKSLHEPYHFQLPDVGKLTYPESITSIQVEGWAPFSRLLTSLWRDGSLYGSAIAPVTPIETPDHNALRDLVKWSSTISSLHRQHQAQFQLSATDSMPGDMAMDQSWDHRHQRRDLRVIRQAILRPVSLPEVSLAGAREVLNDLADVDGRDFMTIHDLLVTSAVSRPRAEAFSGTFSQGFSLPIALSNLPSSDAVEAFHQTLDGFISGQTLADSLDLSRPLERLHGLPGLAIARGSQDVVPMLGRCGVQQTQGAGATENQKYAARRLLLDLANAATVVTARDLKSSVDPGDGLARAMHELAVRPENPESKALRFGILQPKIDDGTTGSSITGDNAGGIDQRSVHALLSEWVVGEDPSGYTWQEPGYAPPEPPRVIIPLRAIPSGNNAATMSLPVQHNRDVHFSLPAIDMNTHTDRVVDLFPSTQGAPGRFGARTNVFSKRKPTKKRVMGF